MAKENKSKGNVPNLRFPGFEGEWKEEKLGDVAAVSSGGTPNRSTPSYWNGNIPWVSTSLIDFNFIEKVDEHITEEGLYNSSAKLFPKGTLLMAMYGQGKTRGKVAILNIEATTNQACGAITTNSEILNPLFAFQNLTKRYDEIRDLSNQGGQENLSAGIIKGIKINFPEVQEQQKIVSFLALIDERIATQNKIIKGLQSLIKNSSRILFEQKNRGNQNSEKVRLEEVTESIISGKSNTTNLNSGKYPLYGSTGIIDFNDEFTHSGKRILIARVGANAGFLYRVDGKYSVTDNTLILTITDSEVDIDFVYYYLLYFNLNKLVFGSGQPLITGGQLKNLEIYLPPFPEQKRLSGMLNSINSKIKVEEQIIDKLKVQKKYLLQNLFI